MITKKRGKIFREKIPTSKKIVAFCLAFTVVVWASSFILAWNGKESLSDVTVAAFTILTGSVISGYYAVTGYRDGSVNRVEREYVKTTGYGRTFDNGKWRNSDGDREEDQIGD